jgi:hypothetical protein
MNRYLNRLPFTRLAERNISAETRAKHPLLNKMIPHANLIIGVIIVLLIVLVIAIIGFDRTKEFLNKILGFLRNTQNLLENT